MDEFPRIPSSSELILQLKSSSYLSSAKKMELNQHSPKGGPNNSWPEPPGTTTRKPARAEKRRKKPLKGKKNQLHRRVLAQKVPEAFSSSELKERNYDHM